MCRGELELWYRLLSLGHGGNRTEHLAENVSPGLCSEKNAVLSFLASDSPSFILPQHLRLTIVTPSGSQAQEPPDHSITS
jgi:hypothetical protein